MESTIHIHTSSVLLHLEVYETTWKLLTLWKPVRPFFGFLDCSQLSQNISKLFINLLNVLLNKTKKKKINHGLWGVGSSSVQKGSQSESIQINEPPKTRSVHVNLMLRYETTLWEKCLRFQAYSSFPSFTQLSLPSLFILTYKGLNIERLMLCLPLCLY